VVASHALNSYAAVQVDAGVEGASSHQLITMLFDGVYTRLAQAKGAIQQNDLSLKAKKVSETMKIIMGLREFLDFDQGGELAANLDALYDYIQRTLMQGHIKNDPAKFDECRELLAQVGDAWSEIS
tara:strand:- start:30545 stop:30922 length:378 start_codon:yes stop_codon:yes gene_type:complete